MIPTRRKEGHRRGGVILVLLGLATFLGGWMGASTWLARVECDETPEGTDQAIRPYSTRPTCDPGIPRAARVYHANTTGDAKAVTVSGNYAYLATGDSGLAVINITDPTDPGPPLAYVDTGGNALGVCVSGDYAYVADREKHGTGGLVILNISDPTVPVETGSVWEMGARTVQVHGDLAYVAKGASGLAVVNVSDPTDPEEIAAKGTDNAAYDIVIAGDVAYVADHHDGLTLFNISDPTDPTRVSGKDTSNSARGVVVSGDYAYLADDAGGLACVNVTHPVAPGTVVQEDTAGNARGVHVSGNLAFIADGAQGLAVFNISAPIAPTAPEHVNTTGYAQDVVVRGEYAFVADGPEGLAVIDVAKAITPAAPVHEDMTDGSRTAHGVHVYGNYAYLANWYDGLEIFNVSDPTAPGTPVHEYTANGARDVLVSGDFAYVASSDSGLAVINVSDPSNPGSPVYAGLSDVAREVALSGNFAYVADTQAGLAIVNVSDPTTPALVTHVATTGDAYGVCVRGNRAFVANWDGGLAIVDISDPTAPGDPQYVATTGTAAGVTVRGNFAFVADWNSGLAVINISNPGEPGTPVYANTDGSAASVFVCGNQAFVADYDNGLTVVDVSDPTHPGEPVDGEGSYLRARDVFVSGAYAYVADDDDGLAVSAVYHPFPPGDFNVTGPTGWVTDQTPTVTCAFTEMLAGVDVSTVEFASSTSGDAAPTNWMPVDGVYEDAGCTDLAEDGDTGFLYARVLAVGFGQDSGTQNTIRFRASDLAGHAGLQAEAKPILVDTTGPTLDFTSPTNETFDAGTRVVDIDATDATSGVDAVWYARAGTNETYSGPTPLVFPGGTHTIHAWANDSTGNETYANVTFTVDATAPTVTITSPASETYDDGTRQLEIHAVDGVTEVDAVWYEHAGTNETYSGPTPLVFPEGTHTIHAWANDSAGNEGTDEVTFTVDTTAPTVTITSPAAGLTAGPITVALGGDAAEMWYYIAGVDQTNRSWTGLDPRALADGTYTLHAYGNDSAGNEAHAQVTFTVDATPPTVTINSPPAGTIADDTITVALGGDAAERWYYITGVDQANRTWTGLVPRTLPDGAYTLHAYGNDSAGNIGHDEVTFTVDTTPPGLTITSPPAGTVTNATITVILTGNATTTWYQIGSVDPTRRPWTGAVDRTLPDGTYTLQAWGNDTAGNVAHATVTFTVDTSGLVNGGTNGTTTGTNGTTTGTTGNGNGEGAIPSFLPWQVLTAALVSVGVVAWRWKKRERVG